MHPGSFMFVSSILFRISLSTNTTQKKDIHTGFVHMVQEQEDPCDNIDIFT